MVSVTGFPSRVIWTWTEPRPCAAAKADAAEFTFAAAAQTYSSSDSEWGKMQETVGEDAAYQDGVGFVLS